MNLYNRLLLWAMWVLSTLVGALLVLLVIGIFPHDWFALFPLLVAVNFAIVGCTQWLVLRRIHIASAWWIVATTTSGCVGSIASWIVTVFAAVLFVRVTRAALGPSVGDVGVTAAYILGGFVLGSCVGVGQWLILRQYLPRSGWWIVISMSAGVLASIVGPMVSRSHIDGFPISAYLGVLSASFILGICTGWLLLRLITQGAARGAQAATH